MSRAALVSLKGNKEVGGGGINGAGRRWEREGFAPGLSWEDGGGKARRLFGGLLGWGAGDIIGQWNIQGNLAQPRDTGEHNDSAVWIRGSQTFPRQGPQTASAFWPATPLTNQLTMLQNAYDVVSHFFCYSIH